MTSSGPFDSRWATVAFTWNGLRAQGVDVKVLATQPNEISKFNSFEWMPPKGSRAGEVLLTHSTVSSTLLGADDSLKQFCNDLATAKVIQHL